MGVRYTGAQRLSEPVGIRTALDHAYDTVTAKIVEVPLVEGARLTWGISIVQTSQILVLQLLLRRQEVVVRQIRHREAERTAIVHSDRPFADGLRRDDDDPGSSLSPVESRGRGVLEHRDTLDGIHIHVIDVVDIYDRSVDDEEWEVSCTGEGRTTTQVEVRASIGVGAQVILVDDLQTGYEGFKPLQEILSPDR